MQPSIIAVAEVNLLSMGKQMFADTLAACLPGGIVPCHGPPHPFQTAAKE